VAWEGSNLSVVSPLNPRKAYTRLAKSFSIPSIIVAIALGSHSLRNSSGEIVSAKNSLARFIRYRTEGNPIELTMKVAIGEFFKS
jgi:hypothetical protein